MLATAALQRGCDSESLRLLGGVVGRPTMADVHELVEACFRDSGVVLPSEAETSAWLVNRWLSRICEGTIPPHLGASQIASLSSDWWDEPSWLQLRDFIGLASEWQDHPAHREEIDQQIANAARHLQSQGGFGP